jgi:D-alanyl-D-alanine endopeptidase (penicillin-binding protein 7)
VSTKVKKVAVGVLGVVTALAMATPLAASAAAREPAKKRSQVGVGAPVPVAASRTQAGRGPAVSRPFVVVRNSQSITVAAVRRSAPRRLAAVLPMVAARPSHGELYGLHSVSDSLDLKSGVALVLDQDTNEVLFSKNPEAVLPIASLTKLMTALVVTEAKQPLDDLVTVTQEDIDTEKGSRSRLSVGTQLSRQEMLHLALMSSENRAAHALGRHFPGGLATFVAAMNRKARELGMNDTRYVEPTGLSSRNQSSARDLAILVKAAHEHQIIRELSTSHEFQVAVGNRPMQFRNTNGLVRSPSWEIGLQKTGYISEAGRCLVMQAKLAGRKVIMVFLDSAGKHSRIGDAERIRRWVTQTPHALPAALAPTPVVAPASALPKLTS